MAASVANIENAFIDQMRTSQRPAVGSSAWLDGSWIARITSIFCVKPKTFCKLLRARSRFTGLEYSNVHLKERSAEIKSDVVRVDEDGTRFEYPQSGRNARIVLVESRLSPLLLVGKATQRLSDNSMVDLEAKEALLLIDEVAHVDDDKQGRVLGAEEEPQEPADDGNPNRIDDSASPR